MKIATITYCPKTQFSCPKATFKRIAHKVLDILLITASGMGIAAMLMFMAVL